MVGGDNDGADGGDSGRGGVAMLLMTEVMAVADVMVVGDGRCSVLKWLGQKQA